MNLKNFFNPKSVAVIGASNNKKKLGYQIVSNIKENGFKGNVYPVNLKEEEICGFKVFGNVGKINKKVDLAIIVIPAAFVIGEIKKCALAGIKNIIIISAGFAEVGEKGRAIEEDITNLASRYKLNILGPNCLGMINTGCGLNATFAASKNKKGDIAFISQSGAIGGAILDWARNKNIGFSKFVSLGNKAGVDENDLFNYFINDSGTNLVAVYLEEIKDGRRFMKIVSALSKVKPVAIIKAGQSEAGRQAAASHTGSMAGSGEAAKIAFKRAGIINLYTIEEMFELVALYNKRIKAMDSITIISNGGGLVVLAVDRAAKSGLSLPQFSDKTVKKLKNIIPSMANIKNPLDILGDAPASRFKESIGAVLADKNVSNLLILLTPQTATEPEKTARAISALNKKYKNKFICASFIGGRSVQKAKNILTKNGVANFDFPNDAIDSLAKLARYWKEKDKIKPYKFSSAKNKAVRGIERLDYIKSLKLLNQYKIPTARTVKIANVYNLRRLKYPVALKATGDNIIHKTDIKAIALNIKDYKNAVQEFNRLSALVKNGGYCVAQPMAADGLEMIVGFKRDESFGPIMLVGAGGIYTEILKDVQAEVDDVTLKRAREMAANLKMHIMLKGARGQAGYDINALAKVIVNLARLAREHVEIQELDVNPLVVLKRGVVAADVRIIL